MSDFISTQCIRLHKIKNYGRSMIEMLGVLAIIGVLSIGALYAYKQAMNIYRVNRIMAFMGQIQFAIDDACFLGSMENCPIKNSAYYTENQKALCGVIGGGVACEGNRFSFYPSISWLIHINWNPNSSSKPEAVWRIYRAPDEMCVRLIGQNFHREMNVSVGQNAYISTSKTGVFSPEQQKTLTEQCINRTNETTNSDNIVFLWKPQD